MPVNVLEGQQHAPKDTLHPIPSVGRRIETPILEHVVEIGTLDELERDPGNTAFPPRFEHADDVGMAETCQGPVLAFETFYLICAQLIGMENLHGHRSTVGADPAKHLRNPTGSEERDKLVGTDAASHAGHRNVPGLCGIVHVTPHPRARKRWASDLDNDEASERESALATRLWRACMAASSMTTDKNSCA